MIASSGDDNAIHRNKRMMAYGMENLREKTPASSRPAKTSYSGCGSKKRDPTAIVTVFSTVHTIMCVGGDASILRNVFTGCDERENEAKKKADGSITTFEKL